MRLAVGLGSVLLILIQARGGAVPSAAPEDPKAPANTAPASLPPRDELRIVWLRQHAVPVRTLEPGDQDFSDLRPLAAAIGRARIVMLGEISHGDGAAFKAKVRLVKYLHQELGFSLLAFESGFYDCAKAWDLLAQGEEPRIAARRAVFPIWSRSEEVAPLWTYLGEQARGPRPLELAGIDPQLTGSASRDFLTRELERYLADHGARELLASPEWSAARDGIAKLAAEAEPKPPDEAARDLFHDAIARLVAEVRGYGPQLSSDRAFWLRVLDDIDRLAEIEWESDRETSDRLRDQRMASHLLWLARERHPQAKIIVWAATRHILGEVEGINLAAASDLSPVNRAQAVGRTLPAGGPAYGQAASAMGREVRAVLGDEVFALGFLAAEGRTGKISEWSSRIAPPQKGSLEDLLRRADLRLAILDLRRPAPGGEWLRERLLARPLGYVAMRADWSRCLDAFFFIRSMTPATRAREQSAK